MKLIIHLLLITFSFTMLSCESTSRTNYSKQEQSKPTVSFSKKVEKSKAILTGANVFIDYEDKNELLSQKTKFKLLEISKVHLSNNGYQIVKKRANSHLTYYIYVIGHSKNEHTLKPSSISEKTTIIKNGKIIYQKKDKNLMFPAALRLETQVNRFGLRPKRLISFYFKSPTNKWEGYEDNLINEVLLNIGGLFLPAPKKNVKMAGPSGCLPMFGYEEENNVVTKVRKGSAAMDTGIKVNDIILAIDSEKEVSPNTIEIYKKKVEIYNKRLRVPIKIKRGQKILRKTIRAKVMCI